MEVSLGCSVDPPSTPSLSLSLYIYIYIYIYIYEIFCDSVSFFSFCGLGRIDRLPWTEKKWRVNMQEESRPLTNREVTTWCPLQDNNVQYPAVYTIQENVRLTGKGGLFQLIQNIILTLVFLLKTILSKTISFYIYSDWTVGKQHWTYQGLMYYMLWFNHLLENA